MLICEVGLASSNLLALAERLIFDWLALHPRRCPYFLPSHQMQTAATALTIAARLVLQAQSKQAVLLEEATKSWCDRP